MPTTFATARCEAEILVRFDSFASGDALPTPYEVFCLARRLGVDPLEILHAITRDDADASNVVALVDRRAAE